MAYYKSNHPDVLAAVDSVREEKKALQLASLGFAAEMGGQPYYLSTLSDGYLGGLIFSPRRDPVIWTAPDGNQGQRPRAKPKAGATDEQKAEHKVLLARWAATWPKARVNYDSIYVAIGTDWGALIFSGIGYFTKGGFLYVQTKVKLNGRMTEILGSEYAAASEAEA